MADDFGIGEDVCRETVKGRSKSGTAHLSSMSAGPKPCHDPFDSAQARLSDCVPTTGAGTSFRSRITASRITKRRKHSALPALELARRCNRRITLALEPYYRFELLGSVSYGDCSN